MSEGRSTVRFVPLPMSKSQVRKLGSRLRAPGPTREDDLELLAEVLAAYDEALSTAISRLEGRWGLRPTERLKNVGTIVEKLRREGTNLASIQDIAGLRIVLGPAMGRRDQDRFRDLVGETVGDQGSVPRVHDRRLSPSHGYRAVHVVVDVLGLPVEVQIRTGAQHRWAQFFEKLADLLGREIRYGDEPSTLDALLRDPRFDGHREIVRGQVTAVVHNAVRLGDVIDSVEVEMGQLHLDGDLWARIEGIMTEMEHSTQQTLADIKAVLAS